MNRQVVFTLGELARAAGLSKYRTQNLIQSNGVQMFRAGNRKVVLVSSLETAFPELTDSIRFRTGEDDE
jgi:hypothetical protein